MRDQHGHIRGVAQTWWCELRPPENAVGFSAKQTYTGGVRLPRGSLHQVSGSRGRLVVAGDYSNALQRHTTCAELHSHQIASFPAARLVDCYLEFMSETSFSLGGLAVREAFEDQPQKVERGGWLCEFDVPERQLTKSEYRLLR